MSSTVAMHVSSSNRLGVSGGQSQPENTSPREITSTPFQARSVNATDFQYNHNGHEHRSPNRIPSPARMTRKRIADLANLKEPAPGQQEDLPFRSGPTSYGTQICLCQPEPKIPRPRNAFILYRQHHHLDIIGQNPGLSNPEISKIAGQLWSKESEPVKLEWKRLAEQEKVRHAQQYPDYRFQPRHKARKGLGIDPNFNTFIGGSRKYRCQKCGGQSTVDTGNTPLSPPGTGTFSTSNSSVFHDRSPLSPETRQLPLLTSLTLNSPHGSAGSPMTPFPTLGTPAAGMSESKRRRFNPYNSTPLPATVRPLEDSSTTRPISSGGLGGGGGMYRSYPSPATPATPGQPRRESLPPPTPSNHPSRISNLRLISQSSPTNSGPMGPPPPRGMAMNLPGVHAVYPQTPRGPYPDGQGEGIRLPPLHHGLDAGRSIEGMIMSMPFLGKIKLLRSVAQPLKSVGSSSPMHRNRGAIIAIEGDKDAPVDVVLHGLEEALRRTGEFDINVIHGPADPSGKVDIGNFVEAVAAWHTRVTEIRCFVTGLSTAELEETTSHRLPTTKDSPSSDPSHMDLDKSPEADTIPNGRRDSTHSANSKHSHSSLTTATDSPAESHETLNTLSSSRPSPAKVPILLIPHYLVHASNAWAIALPINDTYQPTDHWQWVATLWRGVPGADYTVYVSNPPNAALSNTRNNSGAKGSDNGQAEHAVSAVAQSLGAGAEWANKLPVEIREELGTMVVRNDNGQVEDVAIRRVAFELGEWARLASKKARLLS